MKIVALATLAQHWNTTLKCFEFPNLDLIATFEECACILGITIKEGISFYFRLNQHLSEAKAAEQLKELLGLPTC